MTKQSWVYKVCHRRHGAYWEGSSTWAGYSWNRAYALDDWTTPVSGTGLFVFRRKQDALRYAGAEFSGYRWIVYRCEHAGRLPLPLVNCADHWKEVWSEGRRRRGAFQPRNDWPEGTVAVRAVRPVAVVTYNW